MLLKKGKAAEKTKTRAAATKQRRKIRILSRWLRKMFDPPEVTKTK